MPFINTMMRAMTHLNIGAAIAMFAWILWSGYLIVQPDASRGSSVRPAVTGAPSPALPQRNEASEVKP
jgi:hypothetical protein